MDYKVTSPAPIISTRKLGGWAFARKRKNEEDVYQPQAPLPVGTVFSGEVVTVGNKKYVENPIINGKRLEYTIVYIAQGGKVYAEPVAANPAELPVTRAEFDALAARVAALDGK